MASSDYSGLTCGNSVSEVLKLAHGELRELRAHYRAVTERIRKLRIVVDALGELDDQGTRADGEENLRSSGHRPNFNSNRTSAIGNYSREKNKPQKRIRSLNPDLCRACRIALMETLEPASPEDVYRRIVRRGSFRFATPESARSSIVRELHALYDGGELERIEGSRATLWQRIIPAGDSADRDPS